MKLATSLFIAVASTSIAHGALYTLGNGSGASASGVITTDGKTFRNLTEDGSTFSGANGGISGGPGVVSFGVFSTDDFSGARTSQDLTSLFTSFGSATTFNATGPSGARSIFSSAQSSTIAGAFAGQNIYVFIGNSNTHLSSTEFLILKMNETFLASDDETFAVTPKEITVNTTNSQALFGSLVANVFTTNGDPSQTQGWQMAVIPEPSALLLGAVGALGLLRRRRN